MMSSQDLTNLRIAVKLPNEAYWREVTLTENVIPLVEPPPVGDNAPRVRGFEDMTVGVIVPMFANPAAVDWMHLALISNNYHGRGVHFVVIVDVNQGPGLGVDNGLRNQIRLLKTNGATVIGYVDTMQGLESEINIAMTNWKTWYPELDGFFYDKMTVEGGDEQFFNNLDRFAKYDLGCTFTAGGVTRDRDRPNQLIFDAEGYFRDTTIDLVIMYRQRGFIVPLSSIKKPWMSAYPRKRFGAICSGIYRPEHVVEVENFVREAVGTEKAVGYLYLHSDPGHHEPQGAPPGAFEFLSSLLETTCRTLSAINSEEVRSLPDRVRSHISQQRKLEAVATTRTGARATDLLDQPTRFASPTAIPAPEDRDLTMDSPDDYDRWGIKKIYQDNLALNRQQSFYFDDEEDRGSPGIWESRAGISGRLRRTPDGDYILEDGRLWINSESANRKWLNTEQTAFFYYEGDVAGAKHSGSPSKYAFQFKARGGAHDKDSPCEAGCYTSRVYTDGRVVALKEIMEKLFGAEMGEARATGGVSVQGRWIGLKQIVYNWQEEDEGLTYVVIETWVDDQCTDSKGRLNTANKWRLVSTVVDRGAWPLRDQSQKKEYSKLCRDYQVSVEAKKNAKRMFTDIISLPGGVDNGKGVNRVQIRGQGVTLRFRKYSIREIIAPVHPINDSRR